MFTVITLLWLLIVSNSGANTYIGYNVIIKCCLAFPWKPVSCLVMYFFMLVYIYYMIYGTTILFCSVSMT